MWVQAPPPVPKGARVENEKNTEKTSADEFGDNLAKIQTIASRDILASLEKSIYTDERKQLLEVLNEMHKKGPETKSIVYHFPDSWAAATKQFFKSLGAVVMWAMFLLVFLHSCGSLDIVEVIHGRA